MSSVVLWADLTPGVRVVASWHKGGTYTVTRYSEPYGPQHTMVNTIDEWPYYSADDAVRAAKRKARRLRKALPCAS